jgi:hypothetical protein
VLSLPQVATTRNGVLPPPTQAGAAPASTTVRVRTGLTWSAAQSSTGRHVSESALAAPIPLGRKVLPAPSLTTSGWHSCSARTRIAQAGR